ncbi:MAG TPA: hypothetical protein VMA71_05100 [Alloacidobacterium sp.]|nr:hypothetical protein [Alloacidobacterium sp.]
MRAENSELRFSVLLVDGGLALMLGLALLYLQGVMTDFLFDIIASVSVVLLSAAVFMLLAVADFFAAVQAGFRQLRTVVVYLLAAAAFATVAVLLAFGSVDAMRLLLTLVILHGFIFGTVTCATAQQRGSSAAERIILYVFGVASLLFSGAIAGFASGMDDRSFVAWMGAYLCLAGAKLLYIAGDIEYRKVHPPVLSRATSVPQAH